MDFNIPSADTLTMSEAGTEMHVRDALGRPILLDGKQDHPFCITMMGPDSVAYRRGMRDQVRKRVSRPANDPATGLPIDYSADDERESIETMVACTISWRNCPGVKGTVPFSKEAARALYTGFPVIRDQVDVWMATRANFIKAS